MKCLPVICLLLFPVFLQAQHIPDSATSSAGKFADYLQQQYNNPSEKLEALYSWITSTIRYDKDSAMYFNWNAGHDAKIAATLRRRKGVCENFASLFVDIAGRLNIPAYVVHGYPAWSDKNKDNSHSWVAIQHKEEWYLCDPTWDAQSAAAEKYYMVSPAAFIRTHIPFDPLWQLLEQPVHYKIAGSTFMYKDSVQVFLQLDSLQQFLAAERRMKNSTAQNNMTKNWQSYNRMNVAIIAGEEDMHLYNAAVEALNKANNLFNEFVVYRNAGFKPFKKEEEIMGMLSVVEPLLRKAENKLESMGKLVENFQYDSETIHHRIILLEKRIQEQQLFLKQYFAVAQNERGKLLYK